MTSLEFTGNLELGIDRASLQGARVDHTRLGHQRLLVGYRDDDPRRYNLAGTIRGGIEVGKCVDCKHPVYVDASGLKCIADRDPALACMFCHEHLRDVERIHQSGMVTQL